MKVCIFCQIAAGEQPASIVYRDDVCIAFLDNQPINEGHTLVIPIEHAEGLEDLPEATGGRMFQVAQRVAHALRESDVPCEGVNLMLADGAVAGQEVDHVHLHVIPRVAGDGFGFRFGPGYGSRPDRSELDAVAERIQEAL